MPMTRASQAAYASVNSLVSAVGDWLRKRRSIRQNRRGFDEWSNYEVARIAQDVGLSSQDLREMN